MYTLIDLNWIKKDDDGTLFTNKSPQYQDYVDHCDNGAPSVSVENSDLYETAVGSFGGKSCIFCKISASGKALRSEYLNASKKRKRGLLIKELCQSILLYITGKNDASGMSSANIDSLIANHASLLAALSQNRHNTAKSLIDAIVPDALIEQKDLDSVNMIYDSYMTKISEVV